MIYLDNILDVQDVYIPRQTQNTNASTRYITDLELSETMSAETARTESTYAKKNELSAYTRTNHFATVNGQKITEGGNIEIEGAIYTGGNNIHIDEDNVISVTGITIPSSNTAFTNDAGYVTSGDVENQIYNKQFPSKNWVNQQINSAIVSETARTENTYLKEHQSLSAYSTTQQVNSAITTAVNVAKNEIYGNMPSRLSQLTNDTNFINYTVNNLLNYYRKDETYSQAQINALIEAIPHFQVLVVPSLPQTGLTNTVYLVRNQETGGADLYDEWIWVNNSWEHLGTARIDLSQYYTSAQTETAIINAIAAETARTESTYIKEHQSLSAYSTTDQVEQMVEDAKTEIEGEIPTVPTNVSDFVNDAGYITTAYTQDFVTSGEVETQINAKDFPNKNWVNSVITNSIETETARTENTYAKIGDIPSLEGYATTAFTEATYLKEHQDISGKLDSSEFNSYTSATQTELAHKQDASAMTEYATTAFTESTYLKEHQSLDNYYTSAQTQSAISAATQGMATTGWVESQGYLTEHQSLDNYYTKAEINAGIGQIENQIANKADSSAVTEEISTALEDYTPTSGLNIPTRTSELVNDSDFVTTADLPIIPTNVSEFTNDAGYITVDALDGYATTGWVENQGYLTEHQSLDNYYTKGEIDAGLQVFSSAVTSAITDAIAAETARTESTYLKEHQSLSAYSTTEQVNSAITSAITGVKAEIEGEIPTKVSDLQNDANFVNSGQVNTQIESKGYITGYTESDPVFMASAASGITSSDISNWNDKQPAGDYALRSELPTVPTSNTAFTNDAGYVTSGEVETQITNKGYATTAFTESTYLKEHQSLSAYTPTSGFTTINGSAITNGGNIQIEGRIYSAGTNINIDQDNVISVTGITIPDVSNFITSGDAQTQIDSSISGKQDTLISGTNIKTINNQSILGSGNITIQGGGGSGGGETVIELTQAQYDALTGYAADTTYIITDAPSVDLDNYYTSAQTESAISAQTSLKQDTLISGTNIKTINNQSILGNGDIYISPGNYYYAGDGLMLDGNTFKVAFDVNDIASKKHATEVEEITSRALNELNNKIGDIETLLASI